MDQDDCSRAGPLIKIGDPVPLYEHGVDRDAVNRVKKWWNVLGGGATDHHGYAEGAGDTLQQPE